jgi:Lon protease-like protein
VTRRLAMFPLESVLLPGSLLPLHVFEERYRIMIGECLAGDGTFGVVLIERGREVGGGDWRVDAGTVAVIVDASELPGGRFALVCRGTTRLRVVEWLPDDPYPVALVEISAGEEPAEPEQIARAETSVRRAWALLSELGADSPLDPAQPVGLYTGAGGETDGADSADDGGGSGGAAAGREAGEAWAWCGLAPLTALDRFRLLEVEHHAERLDLLCELTDAVADDARKLLTGGGAGASGSPGGGP